jgi:hypothetical protein
MNNRRIGAIVYSAEIWYKAIPKTPFEVFLLVTYFVRAVKSNSCCFAAFVLFAHRQKRARNADRGASSSDGAAPSSGGPTGRLPNSLWSIWQRNATTWMERQKHIAYIWASLGKRIESLYNKLIRDFNKTARMPLFVVVVVVTEERWDPRKSACLLFEQNTTMLVEKRNTHCID